MPTATSTPEPTQTPALAYKLVGLDFGPYIYEGQNPGLGTVITQEQFESELDVIAPYTNWVRSYGCQGMDQIVPIAHARGLKVALGAWLSSDLTANEAEISCLINAGTLYHPEMVIVGSEVLYRGDLTPAKLVEYMAEVRAALPGLTIATADTPEGFLNNKAVVGATDVILTNIYPYWAGVSVKNSIAWLNAKYQKVVAASLGKKVWISETGWPSCGNSVSSAEPSVQNSNTYFLNFISWARAKDVSYFYFEAFNEPWKGTAKMPQEACWGTWESSGLMKSGMQQVFDGAIVADNWSPTATSVPTTAVSVPMPNPVTPVPSGPPQVELVSVPPIGSYDNLVGKVINADPLKYEIAAYINVNGGWWTKPYWDTPLTPIAANGYFRCNITTGGVDEQATEIIVFLVPKGYSVPLASGGGLDSSLSNFPNASATR